MSLIWYILEYIIDFNEVSPIVQQIVNASYLYISTIIKRGGCHGRLCNKIEGFFRALPKGPYKVRLQVNLLGRDVVRLNVFNAFSEIDAYINEFKPVHKDSTKSYFYFLSLKKC